jgi:hypothetical protein
VSESLVVLNQRRVDPSMEFQQARSGRAVILVGKRWHEFAKAHGTTERPAVVHKSPQGLRPWQGRVLMTIDVTMKGAARDA